MTRRAAALLAVITLGAGCSRTEPSAIGGDRAPSSSHLTTLRMNVIPSLSYSAFMIAKAEGFFEQEGIDAQFVGVDANQLVLAATTGELDVVSLPVRPGMFNAMLRGVHLQIVADKGHSEPGPCAAEGFVAPIATAERIERNRSFRGERFVKEKASQTEYLVDRLLEMEGLQRSDVQFAELPNSEAVAAIQDRIDLVIYTQEPKLSNLLSQRLTRLVRTAEEVAPGHQYSVVAFGRRLLRDEPDLGHRFMRAYLRGVRQYNEGKTDRNVLILARSTQLPAEMIRRACWAAIHTDGRVRPEAIEGYLDWSLRVGYLDAEVPVSLWWNSSYVEAAAKP